LDRSLGVILASWSPFGALLSLPPSPSSRVLLRLPGVKKFFLLSLPSPLSWELLPQALLELVIMYAMMSTPALASSSHCRTAREKVAQEAAVHAVKANVKIDGEYLETF
jgi:hypothetical protein